MGDDVVGAVGRVLTRIRGAAGPGEVSVVLHGSVARFVAYSDDVLEARAEVLVIGTHGPQAVDVIGYDSGAIG